MGTYEISNHIPKMGETVLQSGMTLKASTGDGNSIEGPCDFVFGKLYIYPESGDHAICMNVGEEIEVLSEQRDIQELERRKEAIVNRQLDWRSRLGERARDISLSDESW